MNPKIQYYRRLFAMYREFYSGKSITSHYPYHLFLEITNRCNLKCRMCPVGYRTVNPPGGFMEIELIREIANQLKGKVVEISLHVLGEPLLHPEFIQIVNLLKGYGFKLRLYTNATLLTNEMTRAILSTDLDYINFSVDGYEASEYERIRIGGSWRKVMMNITQFLEQKNEKGRNKPFTVYQSIELSENDSIDRITAKQSHLSRIKSYHPDLIRIIKPNSLAGENLPKFSADKIKRNRYLPCNHIWSSMAILANGDYSPCCIDTEPLYKLGNFREKSFIEVWNGTRMQQLRSMLYSGKYKNLDKCKSCSELWKPHLFKIPMSRPLDSFKRIVIGY